MHCAALQAVKHMQNYAPLQPTHSAAEQRGSRESLPSLTSVFESAIMFQREAKNFSI